MRRGVVVGLARVGLGVERLGLGVALRRLPLEQGLQVLAFVQTIEVHHLARMALAPEAVPLFGGEGGDRRLVLTADVVRGDGSHGENAWKVTPRRGPVSGPLPGRFKVDQAALRRARLGFS